MFKSDLLDSYDIYTNELWTKKKRFYKHGFFTKLKTLELIRGISKSVVLAISYLKKEPFWMFNFRLNAYKIWLKMKEPHWLKTDYPPLNYNSYSYYSSPSCSDCVKVIDNKNRNFLTDEVKYTLNQLSIPISKINKIAIDIIFDSVSVLTTRFEKLSNLGIIFCSFSEAICEYPKLVRKYLGSVVSYDDNFFAALNSAMMSDGTFVYIPKNVRCPLELSTYFRINAKKNSQFERTIIIAEEDSYVSYIEGCTASISNIYQLHAAVVEVIILNNATVKYSTIQNWFYSNAFSFGILNFVTKRALCLGKHSKMSWIQCETGSAITWKYPSIILFGNYSIGEFFSVALTHGSQQADTGTKMIHIGSNTSSTIISKGISFGKSENTYRGLVKIVNSALNSRNFTQCDSMLIGNKCGSNTFPIIEVSNNKSKLEHEATISRISEDQLFYCFQRGISKEDSISMIINGFCKDIFLELPLEFSVEAQKLLSISLKNSVG